RSPASDRPAARQAVNGRGASQRVDCWTETRPPFSSADFSRLSDSVEEPLRGGVGRAWRALPIQEDAELVLGAQVAREGATDVHVAEQRAHDLAVAARVSAAERHQRVEDAFPAAPGPVLERHRDALLD